MQQSPSLQYVFFLKQKYQLSVYVCLCWLCMVHLSSPLCTHENDCVMYVCRIRIQSNCSRLYELLWIKIILDDLKVNQEGPTGLYYDKSAINIAHNPIEHDWAKHIEIDVHLIKKIKKIWMKDQCTWSYVPSKHQLARVLTKGLSSLRFHDLVSKLGMKDI